MMKTRLFLLAFAVMYMSLGRQIRHVLWAHSPLAMLLAILMGCSSDANTHQALEPDSSEPTIASGGAVWPTRVWSNGRVVPNDAGAGPSVGGTAGHGGSSLVDIALGEGNATSLAGSSSTNDTPSGIGGTANATGEQTTTAPTTSIVGVPNGGSGVANAGTMNASAASGGSAGTAGASPIGGVSTGGTSSTRVYDEAIGPDTPVRVLLEQVVGTPKDDTLQTWIRVENRSGKAIPLKNIEIEYWGKMDTAKSVECVCTSNICGAATVGTFRSAHAQANCGFIYLFGGFELAAGKSMLIDWNCHYSDWSPIDETTHYSYPFNMVKGEEMPRVTVQDRSAMKLLWGVLPE
jgi:hypothetical protein